MKLLLVEDNLSVRNIIKRVVRKFSNEILECADGQEAFNIYQTEQPDFVLMDINLGQNNGIEITRRIVRKFPNAKVIIVTNYDENDLRQAAKDAGAIGYIVKNNLMELNSFLIAAQNFADTK